MTRFGTSPDLNVVCLMKGKDRFVFLYDDESLTELRRTFGVFASHPELDFSWYDAAVLSQRAKVESK